MNINEIPILVSSSDAYADLWPAFFYLLKREWPAYGADGGTIVFNTDKLDFSYPGFDIRCPRAGRDGRVAFGANLRRTLEAVPGDFFLLMMVDYFVEGPVDVPRLQQYLDRFLESDASAFFLTHQDVPSKSMEGLIGVDEIDIPAATGFSIQTIFSFQTAFWRKSEILKFVADWEDPWFAEYYGCKRAQILNPRFWKLADSTSLPIPYDRSGVVHGGGRWLMPSVEKIDFTGVPIDLKKSMAERGIFKKTAHPYLSRLPRELHLLPERILTYLRSTAQVRRLRRNHSHGSPAERPADSSSAD